jgi:hypothetical protein
LSRLLQDYVVHSTLRNVLRALIVFAVVGAVIGLTGAMPCNKASGSPHCYAARACLLTLERWISN